MGVCSCSFIISSCVKCLRFDKGNAFCLSVNVVKFYIITSHTVSNLFQGYSSLFILNLISKVRIFTLLIYTYCLNLTLSVHFCHQLFTKTYYSLKCFNYFASGRRGRDSTVYGFTTTCTYAISAYHH